MRGFFTLVLILPFLGACGAVKVNSSQESTLVTAQAPISTGYHLGTQQKMQAMQHWDQLADKVATQGSQAFEHFFPGGGMEIYVAPAGTTPFAKVYREALITHLVAQGVPVGFSPENSVIVEVKTELINHSRALSRTTDGFRRSVEPGFVQRRDGNGRFLPVPIVAEESGYLQGDTPNAEIQVTTSLVHQNAYIYRDSSIFYVNETEWRHYQTRAPRGGVELKRYALESK